MAIVVLNNMVVVDPQVVTVTVYAMAIHSTKGPDHMQAGIPQNSTFLEGLHILINVTAIFQGRGKGSGSRKLHSSLILTN